MKVDTALNHRTRAVGSLRDIYSRGEHFGTLQSDIITQRRAVYDSVKHCPGWVTQYLHGYEDAIRAAHNAVLVHCYKMPNGDLVSSHSGRDDYYQKKGYSPGDLGAHYVTSGHYWDTKHAGLRPYFVTARDKVSPLN